MLSPMMTVIILAVLWLIVVVPMLFRRHDAGRRERSVDGFGRDMRALGRHTATVDLRPPAESRTEVFVPNARPPARDVSTRRPVPAAEEAQMFPADQSEMSDARAAMMSRRRRSLVMLSAGTVASVVAALFVGGLVWIVAGAFALGLFGYTMFLRSQASRDRDRRFNRQQRAAERRTRGVDLTSAVSVPARRVAVVPDQNDSVVRIDDDDIELQSMDTIDLTGLYSEQLTEASVQRRAS